MRWADSTISEMGVYEERLAAFPKFPWGTGALHEQDEIRNPTIVDLAEYLRRVRRMTPTLDVIPLATAVIVEWAGGALTEQDVARSSADARAAMHGRPTECSRFTFRTTGGVFRTVLLWSLLVDRSALALEDDPSVPMLRIFAAGYDLRAEATTTEIELAFWGRAPWQIRLQDVR